MSKLIATLTLNFIFCAACLAQSQNALTVPGISVAIKLDGAGYGQYIVTNNGHSAIVAMNFQFGCSNRVKQSETFDTLWDSYGAKPIQPFATWASRFRNIEIPACPGGVVAAIFADGHVEGEPQEVAELYDSRKGIDRGIDFVLPLLDKVVQSESNQPNALVTIAEKSNDLAQPRPPTVQERSAEQFLLSIVAYGLTHETNIGVPSDWTIHRAPPIETVMETENLNHPRANAFLWRRKLLEWKKDLAGNLSPQTVATP